MQKKRNLIVFDIDGTLTDSVEIHQIAFKKSLNLIGVTEFNDKFCSYKHHTDFHIARVIYESSTTKLFDKSTSELFEKHLFKLTSNNEIIEIFGAKKFVDYIENHTDFGICFATGSMYLPAKNKLEKIEIKFNPDLLVASNDLEKREEIVEKAIEKSLKHYKVEKFEPILSFGDGLWDLITAKNLSLEFVGIGEKNKKILSEYGMKKHYLNYENLEISEL